MKGSKVFNEDCLPAMREMADNAFDLAIIDPEYGLGEDGRKSAGRIKSSSSNSFGKKNSKRTIIPSTPFKVKNWDCTPPSQEYFNQLFRVSKNQIIFGANHFISKMPFDSSCWVVWDKDNSGDFADCELAWTSFKTAIRIFKFRWNGMLQGDMKNKEIRIHPTQKPIPLYRWLLHKYAKTGDKILDTHLGSGSSRIAAWQLGFDFTGFENDGDYFKDQEVRFKLSIQQKSLF